LYLRPFASTGSLRIPLKSVVVKRGVIAGPATVYDPQLGRTSRFKRYVTFGDFETELADVVASQAPLVALGYPGEQIGAGRIETGDDEWQGTFKQLAARAVAIILVPSLHCGTRAEIDAILSTPEWLAKTMFFIPPDDTVLGASAGPHLVIGASAGPLGARPLRQAAIEALASVSPEMSQKDRESDRAGALLRLKPNGDLTFYYRLQIEERFSFLASAGSNLHLDMNGVREEIERFLADCLEVTFD
jgi:hypothetical protein